MKQWLIFILAMIGITSCIADESEIQIKYDKNYYSPVGAVSKWDLYLQNELKNKGINITLRDKLAKKTICNKTVPINSNALSIYLSLEDSQSVSGNQQELRLYRLAAVMFHAKKEELFSYVFPLCNSRTTILQDRAFKHGEEIVIMNLSSTFDTRQQGPFVGIKKDYFISGTKKTNPPFELELSVLVSDANIPAISPTDEGKRILSAPIMSLNISRISDNGQKANYLRDVLVLRDDADKQYLQGKISLETLNAVQKKYIEIRDCKLTQNGIHP